MTKAVLIIGGLLVLIMGMAFLSTVKIDPSTQTVGPANSGAIAGQNIPDISASGYVSDGADVIDATTEASLVEKLKTFSTGSNGEMAVVTVKSLNGLSVEEFGIRVGEKWKVGKAGKDDGVIVIVSTGDKKVRIEVGRGASITDAQAGQILDSVMVPKLHTGDYSGAIVDGVNALIKIVTK